MRRALLVIDVQNEYFDGKLPISYPIGTLDNILTVMDETRQRKMDTVVIQHTSTSQNASTFVKGTIGWQLHPEVDKRSNDLLVEKNLPGAFTGTNLESWLRSRQIDTVVICGYMTHMCCDTTARQAMQLGFAVEFLEDATGTLDVSNHAGKVTAEELHRAVLVVQESRFSRVLKTSEWLDLI
jgi:nicotinamidase-related amidase